MFMCLTATILKTIQTSFFPSWLNIFFFQLWIFQCKTKPNWKTTNIHYKNKQTKNLILSVYSKELFSYVMWKAFLNVLIQHHSWTVCHWIFLNGRKCFSRQTAGNTVNTCQFLLRSNFICLQQWSSYFFFFFSL